MRFLLILWLCSQSAWAQAWDFKRTWVFAVSSTVFKYDPDAKLQNQGRLDKPFVDAWKSLGVPATQVEFLVDRQAAHRAVLRDLKELLQKTRPGDTLVFYFQGHGGREIVGDQSIYYFEDYDANPETDQDYLYLQEIFALIGDGFRGSRLLLTADCCSSGGLAEYAAKPQWKIPTACLTSAHAHNESTGEWTYTECLIRGLRGDPRVDLNGDGTITLAELGRYTQVEMAFLEDQKAIFSALNGFPRDLALARRQGRLPPHVGRHVVVRDPSDGEDYRGEVVDSRGTQVKVVYPGYTNVEWVQAKELRPYNPPQLSAGTRVTAHCSEDSQWHPGRVLDSYRGLHLIRFEGRSQTYDEWVPWNSLKVKG